MEMFIFKYLITLSLCYNVIAAVAKETLEGDISTEVSPQNDKANVRSKRQRNLGYYDYLHYLLDRHANSADEHLAAHKPLGPYRPYELYLFPQGLTQSAGDIYNQYDSRLQQGVQMFPGFAPNVASPYAGFGQVPTFFPGFGINPPLGPSIDWRGRQKTKSCGNRSQTNTKPKLRYKSQERNRGAIHRNCSYSYRKSKKTETRKELHVTHENGSHLNSHLTNQNSQENSTHIFVLHLGANNCNCSKYNAKSTEDDSRGTEGESNPTTGVPARSSSDTKSSESEFTAVFGSHIDLIPAGGSKPTSNNSSFGTTESVPVALSRLGSDVTPTPSPVSASLSPLSTNSGTISDFRSTIVTSSSFDSGVASAADSRSSTSSILASSDVSATTPSSIEASVADSVTSAVTGFTSAEPRSASTTSSTSTSNTRLSSTSSDSTLSSTLVSVSDSFNSFAAAVTSSPADPSSTSMSLPASASNPRTTSTSSPDSMPSSLLVSSPNSAGSVKASTSGSTLATVTSLASTAPSISTHNLRSASTSSTDSTLSTTVISSSNFVGSVTASATSSNSATDPSSAFTSSTDSTPNPRLASTSSMDSKLSPTAASVSNWVGSVTASGTGSTSATDPSSAFASSTDATPNARSTASAESPIKSSSASVSNSGSTVTASVKSSTSVTDISSVSMPSPTPTPNPRSSFTSSSDSTLSPTSVSTLTSASSVDHGSTSTTTPESGMWNLATSSALPDVSSKVSDADADPDFKQNSEAITAPTSTPASTPILASFASTPSVAATAPSSTTISAAVTGFVSDSASGSASTSTLDTFDKASSSASKKVSLTASEFKTFSKSEQSSHSNSSVLSNNSHQPHAIRIVTAPSASTASTVSRKTSSHEDVESIPIPIEDVHSTFVLETAQELRTPVNQSNVESGNVDLMTFLENLERIDHFPQTPEASSRSSTASTSTQSKTSTLSQTRTHSNISKAEAHVASRNRQTINSNQKNTNERKAATISNDSKVGESIEDEEDHIEAIAGTSGDLKVTNSKDIQQNDRIKDIEKLQTVNDDLNIHPEHLAETFFDDISEAEILRENNPSSSFEQVQDNNDDGTSTFITENLSFHSTPENDTTTDITIIPIKTNGHFKALQFGTGFARTMAETAENNQDTLELEAGNSNDRVNDMTGTGSRFVSILRSPNSRGSFSPLEATFAEPLVSGVYTTKKNEFKYKSHAPPSIYWHRIEQKSHSTNSHLKELRPFESPDFEYVRFPQDCEESGELGEESLSAELQTRYHPELYT